MTGSSGLEQGYRRLLAWYPGAFRRDHADEILGVLMAGAGEGQRRPRPAEAADLLWSGLKMRLRGPALTGESRPWSDALALFSLVAPLFLLLLDVFEVALPYRLHPVSGLPLLRQAIARHPEIGGLSMLNAPAFDVTVAGGVVVAVLVLLGLRWMALAVIAASVVLYGPPVLFACGAVLAAVTPRRSRLLPS